jgi:hypothetical protein
MSAKEVRAGGAYIELGLKDKLQAGLDKAAKRLRAFSSATAAAGAVSAAAGTAILTPLLAASAGFAKTSDDYATTAARVQMAAGAVSELQHAAKMTDVSAGGLEKGLQTLRERTADAANGSKTAQKSFERLGISWEELADMPLDRQFEVVAEGISRIEDPAQQGALAADLLGKAGKELLPLLLTGAGGVRKLREEAKSLGIAMTDAEIATGGELSDNLDRLKDTSKGLVDRIGGALAPALNDLLPEIVAIIASTSQWIRENPQLVTSIAAGAVALLAFGEARGEFGGHQNCPPRPSPLLKRVAPATDSVAPTDSAPSVEPPPTERLLASATAPVTVPPASGK